MSMGSISLLRMLISRPFGAAAGKGRKKYINSQFLAHVCLFMAVQFMSNLKFGKGGARIWSKPIKNENKSQKVGKKNNWNDIMAFYSLLRLVHMAK